MVQRISAHAARQRLGQVMDRARLFVIEVE